MINEILSAPLFGILLSLIAFELGLWLQRKTHLLILNPLLIAIILIIVFLTVMNIPFTYYQKGGDIIQLFLGPATVALAIPLYRQVHNLKHYFPAIMMGIMAGILSGLCSTFLCCYLFGFDVEVIASLLPKSITTPIGIELSAALGGIEAITVVVILITGVIGAVISDIVFRIFHIDHPIAKGIALGTSAHAVGTSKALQLGHVEAAMSSLAIGVSGVLTIFIVPIIWPFLQSLL